jgi:hypothetical protein
MPPVLDNVFILKTRDGRQLVFNEKSTGRLSAVLTDEAGQVIQASQLTALKLWLHLKDDTTLPAGGINAVSDTNILNTGRGSIGNNQTVTGATLTADNAIRLTVSGHGLANGDLYAVRNVAGLKGANGDWVIQVVDPNTIELLGSSGSGAYTGGGTGTKGLHITLEPADNAIVQSPAPAVGAWEWHEAYVLATYGGSKQLPCLFHFPVRNLGKAS